MTKDKDKKVAREQQLLEAARLGQAGQLETILGQFQQLKTKKRSIPLASLRKCIGPNSIRDPVTGFTCLHHAALNGHAECVHLILAHGAKLNAVDYKGSSALHLAAWSGNLQVARILLAYCAKSKTNADERAQGNFAGYEELDLNLRNNDNQTALSLAAQFGHTAVVAELLSRAADPNLRNNHLESPLDLACLNGHLDTVQLLLNASPQLVYDLRRPLSSIPTISATYSTVSRDSNQQQRGQTSGWSSLLRSGGSKETPKDGNGSPSGSQGNTVQDKQKQHLTTMATATPSAAREGRPSHQVLISERLLDHSPLHYAVRRGHLNVVNLLLSAPYEANLYQLTSLGSVMHELAMNSNNCDQQASSSADMMRLFLAHLGRMSGGNLAETRLRWDQLLSARNGQLRSVPDLVSEGQTRASQEMQRLMFELSEQLNLDLVQQVAASCSSSVAPGASTVPLQIQAQHEQPPLFSNSRQISSFVTMQRLRPAKQQQRATAAQMHDQISSANGDSNPSGTQTIDRRRCLRNHSGQAAVQQAIAWDHKPMEEARVQPLTRSVSNLMQNDAGQQNCSVSKYFSTNYSLQVAEQATAPQHSNTTSWCQLFAQNQAHKPSESELSDAHELQMKIDGTQNQQNNSEAHARKRRSKSRDLGSLLMEVERRQEEHLYDNKVMQQHQQLQHQMSLSGHLVRSQTDCSHLLGRFFGGSERGATSGVGCNAQASDFARHQLFQIQPQPRSSENSCSLLTAASAEQRRLVPTTIAQQHSATLDRRAINRHYHVYEHEFYPPRLVAAAATKPEHSATNYQSHHHQRPGKQALAIVAPLVRAEFERAHMSSRHSLNIEDRSMESQEANANQQPRGGERHHEQQMNRFMIRHSRQSMPANKQTIDLEDGEGSEMDSSAQRSLMHGSQSLDSHLSGSESNQLFDSTRRALMRDFDQMLGNELLNKQAGSSSSRTMTHSTSSQNSILTGVSLDMDTRGEHLIVSGTRITMPSQEALQRHITQSASSSSIRSNSSRHSAGRRLSPGEQPSTSRQQIESVDAKQPRARSPSSISSLSHSTSSASSNACLSLKPHRLKQHKQAPPQKPPRPSLKSQQIYKSLLLEEAATRGNALSQLNSVIYDQPNSSIHQANEPQQRPGSRTSASSALITSPMVKPPPVPPLPKMKKQQRSITEPPNERPPPPPVQQPSPLVTTPLNVITTTNAAAANYGCGRRQPDASIAGQAKGSPPSSISSTCSSNKQRPELIKTTGTQLPLDADSGFCTSNSPASTSHDSENGQPGATNESTGQAGSVIMAPPSPRTALMSIEEALMPLEKVRTQEMANQTGSQCGEDQDELQSSSSCSSEIGEPLARASERRSSLALHSEVEKIFGWLGSTSKPQVEAEAKIERRPTRRTLNVGDCRIEDSGYENCLNLQRQLRATRCRSIGNLFESVVHDQLASPAPDRHDGKRLQLHRASLQPLTAPRRMFTPESSSLSNSSDSLMQQQEEQRAETGPYQTLLSEAPKRKEILLKVVVDESSQSPGGDEVFYITPTELKKISNSVGTDKRQRSEAETLTDEELCASVDKNSGYIRFTLRRRRGPDCDAVAASEPENSQASQESDGMEASEQRCRSDGSSAKRTKMNPEPETGQPEEKATEVTEETIQVQAQVEQPVQTAPSARKASADSVCMDTSQASSASSPSSEVSIKSIVSLKAQQPAEVLKGSYGQEATSITVGAVAMADVAGVQTGADETLKRKGSERACSLVSETARKLEAAAAQSQANSMSRPVAAARKTHLDRRPQVARKEPSQDRDEKENVKPVSVPLAKKTICWPPPKPSDDDHRHHDEDRDCKSKKGDLNKPCGSNEDTKSSKSADEPSLPMLGRVTANRLSFQRLIEAEQNKINPPPAANRPKPPPPVKPAGLVARQRFRD